MFEGRMNFKGILVKFLFTNIAIKQFILKVFNFRFFIRKLVMKKTLNSFVFFVAKISPQPS